ncbi:uncharacterized protein O3C94_007892 isoform 2-T2 [Discoglossus pictus]
MDSDSIFSHERLQNESEFSGKEWTFYKRKPNLIIYGLVILSYILILALFITVLTRSTSGTSHTATISELNELRDYVAGLSSKLNNIEETSKKQTCETEWTLFNSSCYFFSKVKMNWMKARAMCMKKDSDLVVITSENEQIFISSVTNSNRHWIGLSDLDDEGVWQWVDGTGYETSYKLYSTKIEGPIKSKRGPASIKSTAARVRDSCSSSNRNVI